MKKINAFLGVSVVFLTLLISCSKSESVGGGVDTTPIPEPPKITANDPEPGWFNKPLSFPYSIYSNEAGDQIIVKANGVITTANPYIVNNVTGTVTVTLTATGKGGTSTPKTVIGRSYAQDTSRLCEPSTIEGKWYWKNGTINGSPEAPINETTKFFVNGTCTLYPPNLPPLTGGRWTMANDSLTTGGQKWGLTFTNDTIFVRSRINTANQLLVETFVKR